MTETITDLDAVGAADLDAITALVKTLNWPHRREDIALFLELGAGRIARDGDGKILGVALWWAFAPAHARLGLVMVSPDAQGRGLGRRLVERVLRDAADRTMVLLATEAGKPLYDKLGFVEIGACRQYQGTYAGALAEDADIRAATADDLPAILALDAGAFGAGREATLRALMRAGRAAVIDDASGITAYAIDRDFGRGSVVGPIVAGRETDAVRLVRALARPGFVRVDIPVQCETLARHLADQGLTPAGADSPVMVRGAWPVPAGDARVFALSSHALG